MSLLTIELKITAIELREAYMALEFDRPEIPYDGDKLKKMKRYYSLLNFVTTKLAKKAISSKHKTKPFKLTLEYFEADCIHQTMMVLVLNQYAQSFFAKLDQKLA